MLKSFKNRHFDLWFQRSTKLDTMEVSYTSSQFISIAKVDGQKLQSLRNLISKSERFESERSESDRSLSEWSASQ